MTASGRSQLFGGVEAGGTKFVCGIGSGPENLKSVVLPTTSPESTISHVVRFFEREEPVAALGIASFGPIDRNRGWITSTPKLAWRNYDIAGTLRKALGLPVGFDTDVNAAALGEARWGAGRELSDLIYVTVGTGIGGGALVNGRLLHGTAHAEMGHMRIQHDWARDPFPGCCPYHGDCLEGLASGPAIQARWAAAPETLPSEHLAWRLEAHYLALAAANLTCTLAPQRILLGGGVMQQAHLFQLIRAELAELLNGYTPAPELLAPQLGARAGVLGALILAGQAIPPPGSNA